MNRKFSSLLGFALVPALSACAQTAPPLALETRVLAQQSAPRASSGPSPAFAADDFIDSIGINGAPLQTRIYTDGPFKGAGTTFAPSVFYDLGIRYYRAVLRYDLTRDDQPGQVLDVWKAHGAKAMLFLDPNHVKDPLAQMTELRRYDSRAVAEVEGPNEPNNKFPPQDLNLKYKGQTDEGAAAAYMTDFYGALKADPKWKGVPVVGFSAIFTDYNLAKGFTGFDYGNIHSYAGYGVPSSSLLSNMTRWNNILPPHSLIKPFVPTETGYNVDKDATNGTFKTGSLRAQALNIPMLLAEYFRHGIKRTYLFAIHNADGYGLLEDDLMTKRPAYFAVKNLLDQVREAKWNPATLHWEGARPFTPRSLNFTLAGAPDTVHTLTLQKSSGDYNVLIWNEVPNHDQNTNRELFPAPAPVEIHFGASAGASATVLTQNERGAYDSQTVAVTNGVLKMSVPASVSIIKIKAGPLPKSAAPASVRGLEGKATQLQADLQWRPVAGAQGYFVFRNGWHIATTTEPKFSERSAWLRPGLGYTYEVAAFDRFGQTASRAQTVVFTPDGRPDLVVTKVWSESDVPGQPAKLRATLKNIGAGPTPIDTDSSVTFFVNGKYTSFGGTHDVLNPGDEVTVEPNGGNTEWAPAQPGSYVITSYADDINRVSGEANESNNKTDWTLCVGETGGGELQLATEQAPVSVDLDKEGARDWIAFGSKNTEGASAKTVVERKAGANQIGELKEFGQGYLSSTLGSPVKLNWPGGSSNSGLWWNGVGHGIEFSVPASPDEQMLQLYVSGINGARGKLEVSLSDESAPAIVSTVFDGNRGNGNWAPIPDSFAGVYSVHFRAKMAGQTLRVRWSLDNEPNTFGGQARLQALTLR